MTKRVPNSSDLLSRRDVRFLLYEWLDAGALAQSPRYAGQSVAIYDAC